jgi:SAM-dependent methyltransferase
LARTGSTVCTFDYSTAVDANFTNNRHHSNVCFAQGDIFCPPYEAASFDKVLCLGVIQHTPSPRRAFESLLRFVKPGGTIVIDVYRLSWRSFLVGKYYMRPITRRLSPKLLHRLVKSHVGWLYPFTGFLHKVVGQRARTLSWAMGMADYRGVYPVDDATAREMSELDTFDMLAPAYDRPQTPGRVRAWLEGSGLSDIHIGFRGNFIVARGTKPESPLPPGGGA